MLDIILTQKEKYPALEYCLNSFNTQNDKRFRLILTHCQGDLLREKEIASRILTDIEYTILHSDKPFSNCLAVNYGRRLVTSEYVGINDADSIFPSNFISSVYDRLEQTQGSIILGACRKEGQEDGSITIPPSIMIHMCGSFLVCKTKDFDEVGGFNPFLDTRGAYMDTDFITRVEKIGCKRLDVGEYYYHPWHPRRDDLQAADKNLELISKSIYSNGLWVCNQFSWKYEV